MFISIPLRLFFHPHLYSSILIYILPSSLIYILPSSFIFFHSSLIHPHLFILTYSSSLIPPHLFLLSYSSSLILTYPHSFILTSPLDIKHLVLVGHVISLVLAHKVQVVNAHGRLAGPSCDVGKNFVQAPLQKPKLRVCQIHTGQAHDKRAVFPERRAAQKKRRLCHVDGAFLRSLLPRIYGRLWVLLKKPSSWRNGAPKSARTTSAWYILGPINLWSGSATAKSPNARVKWLTSLSSSVSAASFWMYSSGSLSARSRRIAASWSNSTTARCADSENTLPWVQMVPAGGWAKRRSRPINVHLSAMRSVATPCTCRSASRAYVSQWPGAKPKSTTLCTEGRKRLKWRSKAAMVEWAV